MLLHTPKVICALLCVPGMKCVFLVEARDVSCSLVSQTREENAFFVVLTHDLRHIAFHLEDEGCFRANIISRKMESYEEETFL